MPQELPTFGEGSGRADGKSQTEHPGSQGVLQVPLGGVPADWPARDGYPARWEPSWVGQSRPRDEHIAL